jgi:DNA-binding response OmpR family regulator
MKKTKLLYVEDEPYLAKIVKESLESRDFEVNLIGDGNLVMRAFEKFKPDLCVLDVMLPNKDGFTVGQEIRGLNPQIPIIYLTAKNQTNDVLKGFESGGNDYIKKPFSMEELIVRINNLMQITKGKKRELSPNTSIEIGKYLFFPQKFELHLEDQIRTLSHRETQLLKILTEHRNFTVNRKDILKQVWGDDSFFNSRNLDVYIKKLRDYLKEDEKVKIVTLKGVGYHFVIE